MHEEQIQQGHFQARTMRCHGRTSRRMWRRGSGGSASSTPGSAGGSTTTTSAAATSMSGTVAIGHALAGAIVTVFDANGNSVTTTSGSNDGYDVSIVDLRHVRDLCGRSVPCLR